MLGDTLLVVEDDDAVRTVLEHTLVFEGFRILSASHGAQALGIMNRITPALVVLDLVLPLVNGIEVLTSMRLDPRLRAVPVLVVTGTNTTARDLQSYRPVTVVHKPVDVDTFGSLIHKLLEGAATA